MTRVNVISRYFDDPTKARAARDELVRGRRLSHRIVDMFDSADGLVDKLAEVHVAPETAKAYADRMSNGGTVVVVQAGYKPLNVARTTREVLDEMGAVDMGGVSEESLHRERPRRNNYSIFQDHPHMLTRERDPLSTSYHMADWPLPLTVRWKSSRHSIFAPHARMAAFPIPLTIRTEPFTHSIFPRHARMADKILPLISHRKPYTGSIIGNHARMAAFPLPLISRRRPRNPSIFPRHQRMATVPFPLLINEKTGKNALIPGHPHMANFPIPLISKREPYTGSAIGRHSRMANFPIPLISRRKPFTGSVISRHGRMANMILPLIKDFSFSKMLGMPTVIRR